MVRSKSGLVRVQGSTKAACSVTFTKEIDEPTVGSIADFLRLDSGLEPAFCAAQIRCRRYPSCDRATASRFIGFEQPLFDHKTIKASRYHNC
jgi:hypothetical protein